MDTTEQASFADASSSGTRIVARITGDPRSDLLLDDLKRAPKATKLTIARRFATRLGEADAQCPFHIPARVSVSMEVAIERLGVDPDSRIAEELWAAYRAANAASGEERIRRVFAIRGSDLGRRLTGENAAEPDVVQIAETAELIGLECEASVDAIVEHVNALAPLSSERDVEYVRRAAHGARMDYILSYERCYEAGIEALEERRAKSAPLFDDYEIDIESRSPNPLEFDSAIAESKAAERAEADERVVLAAETKITEGRGRLTLENFLAVVRATARKTHAAAISVDALRDRCLKAFGAGDGARYVVEVSIEVAREARHLPYDDEAVARRAREIAKARRKENLTVIPSAEQWSAVPKSDVVSKPNSAASREAQMAALTNVPGLVGDLVDWITATSMKPDRTLSFAAALALVGTLAGRLYDVGPSSLRTNIYVVGLAPSGYGKDHARACVNILVEHARCSEWLAGSKIASGTAMRKRVEAHPAILWQIDEFGGFMRQMGDTRNVHNCQIRDHLLEYYETAGDVFRGADYAGERGTPCFNPNVSVHGLSTQTDFFEACRSLSAADGLLARVLVVSVGNTMKASVRPKMRRNEPPDALIEKLRSVTRQRVGGNLNGRLADGSTSSKPMTVPFGHGAEEAFYAAKSRFEKLAFAKRGRAEESLYSRVVEKGLKIALITAIGENFDRPLITLERLQHGLQVAELSTEMMLGEMAGRMADNDRQREHITVKRWVFEAGWQGIGRTALVKRLDGLFNERRLDEILKSLEDGSKEVAHVLRQTGGRPGRRYVAVENLANEEAA